MKLVSLLAYITPYSPQFQIFWNLQLCKPDPQALVGSSHGGLFWRFKTPTSCSLSIKHVTSVNIQSCKIAFHIQQPFTFFATFSLLLSRNKQCNESCHCSFLYSYVQEWKTPPYRSWVPVWGFNVFHLFWRNVSSHPSRLTLCTWEPFSGDRWMWFLSSSYAQECWKR